MVYLLLSRGERFSKHLDGFLRFWLQKVMTMDKFVYFVAFDGLVFAGRFKSLLTAKRRRKGCSIWMVTEYYFPDRSVKFVFENLD